MARAALELPPYETQTNNRSRGGGEEEAAVVGGESVKCRLPGPHGAPYAWAESRQELCESLPYYRAFQSGSYVSSAQTTSSSLRQTNENTTKDSIPYGYLLAGFGASHDVWEHKGRVIISHGGGKSMRNHPMTKSSNDDSQAMFNKSANQDKVHQTADQSLDDHHITALVQSQRNQTPIVMLMAKDYKLSHFILPCAFAVLGWYWITDSWCERELSAGEQIGYVRCKFRFQYLESQGSPWWLRCETQPVWNPDLARDAHWTSSSASSQAPEQQPTQSKTVKKKWTSGNMLKRPFSLTSIPVPNDCFIDAFICRHCHLRSPHVFEGIWMCLSPKCTSFWKLDHGSTEENFCISRTFLQLRKEPLHFIHGGMPFSLLPPSPTDMQRHSCDPLRGLHCTCGRLTCRKFDKFWHCAHCGSVKPIPSTNTLNGTSCIVFPSGIEDSKVNIASGIKINFRKLPEENILITSFTFPEELGSGNVHLIESLNGDQPEADEILWRMQQQEERLCEKTGTIQAIPFRRHELSCHTVKGDLLSQQFTCNYGEEYKHTVKMGTIPLNRAPKSILLALQYINKRTKKVIGEIMEEEEEFNEVYPVKYYETQKMNFHDDGEPGLGPTVSTLSLGVEAKMIFRLKEKYTLDHQLVRQPFSLNEKSSSEERLGYHNAESQECRRGKVEESSIGTWQREKKEDSRAKQISMTNRTLLTLTLRHGCIVIQHGRKLQEMIEHAVQPQMGTKQRGNNRVRIAVTARRIDKDTSSRVI